MAAFANAVMVRYLDFNDVNKALRMGGHPSDMIPAILSVADAHHVSGRQAIVGVVAAYQGFGSIPVHVKKLGWDQGIMVATGRGDGAQCRAWT
jgi:2-methylcitrate dehydratase